MLRALGVVQACFSTEPSRCLAGRRLGRQSLLDWVVRRVTDCTRLDGVVVLACGCFDHQHLTDLVPADVPVFMGDEPDALARFARLVDEYPTEAIVRVPGDNPFVDPVLIDRLITAAESDPTCDYASYCSRDGRPAILSPVGVYAEWFRTKALRKAARAARSKADRENVTRYLYTHPEKFKLRLVPAPAAIDRDDVRLRIDHEEDWDHALTIYDALGPEAMEWQRIADLLDHQPALRRRMAVLNRDVSRH
jgi:spore coat polysaccharide biosynthesis protein SpsF (cytidylyltransferase family)